MAMASRNERIGVAEASKMAKAANVNGEMSASMAKYQ
jgi:hypothetical protein